MNYYYYFNYFILFQDLHFNSKHYSNKVIKMFNNHNNNNKLILVKVLKLN